MSINSWIDGKVLDILQACGVTLPGGDGDTLRSIARSWDTVGTDLTGAIRALDGEIEAVDHKGWHGQAREAFQKHWDHQKHALTDAAHNFHQVAAGLRKHADEIDDINKDIIDICVEIAEMEVAGAALSVFTGFLSDLVANAAVAERVAKICDLVELFTSAAEKVAALIERFASLSEETAAVVERLLTTGAKLAGQFAKKGAESFATNFVADSGSAMANQALHGQKVTVGDDLLGGARAAAGTAAFTAGGATFAEGAHVSGVAGRILRGDGAVGTSINGALGNVAGGLTNDLAADQDGKTLAWDAGINAATGAAGNAQNHGVNHLLEQHGSLGGENLSDRGKLADGAFKNTVGTTLNTGVYAAGSGAESDLREAFDDE
ncbi:WXG100 family type VII secretion target [Streptomyces lydicus]|uniref:WXG100-like domain-containing protein n=1 Tax=Streptomyces lydicus TaxID=47763 RepID=UPI0037027330